MTDAENTRMSASYRKVISREPPWWVLTFHAPSLPAEGVSVRRRTLAELNEAFWNLCQDEYRGKGVLPTEWGYSRKLSIRLARTGQADQRHRT